MTAQPFDDAAPMIRLPVYRGPGRTYGRGDGKLVATEPPSRDIPPFRGNCPRRCPCRRCRIDAELLAHQWESFGCGRRRSGRRSLSKAARR